MYKYWKEKIFLLFLGDMTIYLENLKKINGKTYKNKRAQ